MSSPSNRSSEASSQGNPANAASSTSRSPATSSGWLIIIGIIAIAAVIFAVRRGTQRSTSEAIGKRAPTIDVLPLTGGARPIPRVESALEPTAEAASFHRITLLHFWGTWCPPCRMEYPELVEMVEEFSSHPDFRFVSISCEPSVGESSFEALQRETESYYESIDVSIPTYCDPAGRTRRATAEVLGNPALYYPSTLLIDRRGRIAEVWEGYTPSGVKQMRKAIAANL